MTPEQKGPIGLTQLEKNIFYLLPPAGVLLSYILQSPDSQCCLAALVPVELALYVLIRAVPVRESKNRVNR